MSVNEIKLMKSDSINPFDISLTEQKRKTAAQLLLNKKKEELKKQAVSIYVSEDFPIKFSVFLPLL